MTIEDGDITKVGEFQRTGGWRERQSFPGKGEGGEMGSISQETVGTQSCNRVGLPELRDRS